MPGEPGTPSRLLKMNMRISIVTFAVHRSIPSDKNLFSSRFDYSLDQLWRHFHGAERPHNASAISQRREAQRGKVGRFSPPIDVANQIQLLPADRCIRLEGQVGKLRRQLPGCTI